MDEFNQLKWEVMGAAIGVLIARVVALVIVILTVMVGAGWALQFGRELAGGC